MEFHRDDDEDEDAGQDDDDDDDDDDYYYYYQSDNRFQEVELCQLWPSSGGYVCWARGKHGAVCIRARVASRWVLLGHAESLRTESCTPQREGARALPGRRGKVV